jgi:hypothetical protein
MSKARPRAKVAAPALCALACVMGAAAAPTARAIGDFKINLYIGASLNTNPAAVAAFQRAAGEWEAYISSPVRVNIEADLGAFNNPNVIGSTGFGFEEVNLPYNQVRDRMAARANRPGNEILAYLPTSAQVTANGPAIPNASFDNTTMGVLRANQKALGLVDNALGDPITDGTIQFNSTFAFDYDRGDGIDQDKIDFQTVAAHEIGHVLWFISDTDDYDRYGGVADNATTLDLFRFAADHKPTTPEEFRTFARELRPGVEAFTTDLVNEYPMSTGANEGDGNQASHWKDDFIFTDDTIFIGPLIGLMDPSLPFGTTEEISAADLRAMELIGWDVVVPEPGALGVMGFAGVAMLTRRSRGRIVR